MVLALCIALGIVAGIWLLGFLSRLAAPPSPPQLPPPPGSWDLNKPPGDRFRPD